MEIVELLPGTSEYEEHQQALEFERMNNEAHWQNLPHKSFSHTPGEFKNVKISNIIYNA